MLTDNLKSLRFGMYCRKSTESEDKQVQSIEDQERELNSLVKMYNLNVVKHYSESKSAKLPGRQKFNEMMMDINKGIIDAILCWKPNRLSRNMQDAGSIQFSLQNKIVKAIVTPSKIYFPEDNTFILLVEFGLATEFSRGLAEDVKRGMQSKVRKGWRPMKAPIGYLNDKRGLKGDKKIFKDEQIFPIIKKLWDLLLTGDYSVKEIERIAINEFKLKNSSNEPFRTSTFYKLFQNIFYTGKFYYNGELIDGLHDPMITMEEFNMAQKILRSNSNNNKRPKNKNLPFAGLIKCSNCGCSITAQEKIKKLANGSIVKYIYHRCTRKNKNIKCESKAIKYENICNQIEDVIEKIDLPLEFLEFGKRYLVENKEIEEYDNNIIIEKLENDKKQIEKELNNLFNIFISVSNSNKEILNDEEYKLKKNELQIKIDEINNKIKAVKEDNKMNVDDILINKIEFGALLLRRFKESDYKDRGFILKQISNKNMLDSGLLEIDLAEPFLTFFRRVDNEEFRLELSKYIKDKTKNESLTTHFPYWSG